MKKEEISRLCKRIETLDDMTVEIRKRLDALEQWNADQLDMVNQINLRVAPEQRNALQVEVMDLKKRVADLREKPVTLWEERFNDAKKRNNLLEKMMLWLIRHIQSQDTQDIGGVAHFKGTTCCWLVENLERKIFGDDA